MDDTETTTSSTDTSSQKSFQIPNLTSFPLYGFVSNIPKKVSECIEHFKPLKRGGSSSMLQSYKRIGEVFSTAELNLEKQMNAWRENPMWVDHPPEIKVTVPKGSLCNLEMVINVGLPPDAVYNIVTDPNNKRVFKNIKEVISRKVLVDEGSRQVVEVDQAAIWKFLWWSGTFSVKVIVDQNREKYTMNFKQIESGFMRRFEGSWKMEPIYVDEDLYRPYNPKSLTDYMSLTNGRGRIGSRLILEQLIQPAIVLPPPISWYLRGITTKTTEMLINDLLAEAARMRQASNAEPSGGQAGDGEVGAHSIKDRWALRRTNVRRNLKRLAYP